MVKMEIVGVKGYKKIRSDGGAVVTSEGNSQKKKKKKRLVD